MYVYFNFQIKIQQFFFIVSRTLKQIFAGFPLLNMTVWCLLRIYNNDITEGGRTSDMGDGVLDTQDAKVGFMVFIEVLNDLLT